MEDSFDIIWRSKKVGRIENCMPDMWYLEGTWVPYSTAIAKEFEKLIATFDVKEVMNDPKKGTRVILKLDNSETETHALIHSLTDGLLFLRRVFEKEAINWLVRNVK